LSSLLRVENLRKDYPVRRGALRRMVGTVRAVDDVSLEVEQGATFGLLGESGCGKSTLGRLLMRLEEPTAGSLHFDGVDVYKTDRRAMRKVRRDIQIVFQDPMGALDPRMTVWDIIAEPMFAIGMHKDEVFDRVEELMALVGLDPAHSDRFPTAFSGGQRQRIGIARALSTNPKVVVLDEPVSALDVSIQAGVINLLDELKSKLGLSYLFVAHDLAVIRHIADRVAVMYRGSFVEHGDVDQVFDNPQHPYTKALLSAIPIPDPDIERTRERIILPVEGFDATAVVAG